MPLYRIHYQRDGAARAMTFASLGDDEARAFAYGILSRWVGAPIDYLEIVSARPYRRQPSLFPLTRERGTLS